MPKPTKCQPTLKLMIARVKQAIQYNFRVSEGIFRNASPTILIHIVPRRGCIFHRNIANNIKSDLGPITRARPSLTLSKQSS